MSVNLPSNFNSLPNTVQRAILSGDASKLTGSELEIYKNSVFPDKSEARPTKEFGAQIKQAQVGTPKVTVDTTVSEEAPGVTRYTTTKVVESSDAFKAAYIENIGIGKKIAESCTEQTTSASEMAVAENGGQSEYRDKAYHAQLTSEIAKHGITPEVEQNLTGTQGYIDFFDPSDKTNKTSCGEGVVLNYLKGSIDPHMSALAKASTGEKLTPEEAKEAGVTLGADGKISQEDRLKAIREAQFVIESMQPDIQEHARAGQKIIDDTIAAGGTYEDGVKKAQAANHLDKYGGPIKDADKPWIIPSCMVSKEDNSVVERSPQSDKKDPPPPPSKISGMKDDDAIEKGQTLNIDNYSSDPRNRYVQLTDVPDDTFLSNLFKGQGTTGTPDPISSNCLGGDTGDGYLSLDEIAKGPFAEYLGQKEKDIIAKGEGSKYGYNRAGLTKNNYNGYNGQRPYSSVYGAVPELSPEQAIVTTDEYKSTFARQKRKYPDMPDKVIDQLTRDILKRSTNK